MSALAAPSFAGVSGDDWDSDWYLDNVVLPRVDGHLGPVRTWQKKWLDIAASLRGTSAVNDLALCQGFVVTHAQARECGVTRAESRRRVRRGEWTAPRRDVLCVVPAKTARPGDPWDEEPHGLRPEIRASALALVTGTVISSECAAAAHGLPLLAHINRPTVTDRQRTGGGARTSLIRNATLHRRDITSWFGADITTAARTVTDLARHGVRGGLVAADAALHEGLCTHDELTEVIARSTRWPGVRAARRVCALACAESESVAESLTRLLLDDNSLPLPTPQVEIRTSRGTVRVDGLWVDRAVVLEVDGMLKYQKAGALTREKKRQEALERRGYRVVRVIWDDLLKDPVGRAQRIAVALRRGGEPHLWGADPRIRRDLWA